MPISLHCRRLATAVFTGCAVAAVTLATPIGFGALSAAHAQVSDDFQDALAPYGEWRDHPRWGHVWVPLDRPDGWRPYTYGHWVYTDDWGWYWVSDNDEADWGWVTYHYGRWVFDRGMGWLWVPGEEWAPAWVDWRRGSDAVGWAPLPPEDMAADTEYDQDPNYWIFVQPRYMMAPRLRGYVLPPQRATVVFRDTVLVNRTVRLNRERERIAVNPGIAPNIVAAVTRGAVPTYRVQPRVFAGTQGVQGAVQVRREDFVRRGPPGQPGQRPGPSRVVSVQRTTTVIQPAATVPKPEALGRDDRGGRLGSRPPRAAQGAAVAPAQQQQPAQQQERQQRPAQQPQPQAQPQQQRPAAAPPQTTPPPAGREARPSVSAPPAAQTRPEPPRPGAPQEREEQRQQGRQDNRQDNRQENRQENREERREQRPAVSAPPASAPQARPAAPTAAAHPPAPPPAAPAVQRPAAPPPQAARPPAPPPQAHAPAPPQPHPPAPPQARPPAPPPAAARPAPQPQRPAAQAQHPPPKPGEKPQDDRK